jgi:hypothetical protein
VASPFDQKVVGKCYLELIILLVTHLSTVSTTVCTTTKRFYVSFFLFEDINYGMEYVELAPYNLAHYKNILEPKFQDAKPQV